MLKNDRPSFHPMPGWLVHLQALVVAAGAYGWVTNVDKVLFHSSFDPPGGVVVIRAIGIPVVPLGIVMGYALGLECLQQLSTQGAEVGVVHGSVGVVALSGSEVSVEGACSAFQYHDVP
jgi:hypothetical protein